MYLLLQGCSKGEQLGEKDGYNFPSTIFVEVALALSLPREKFQKA